MTLVSASPGSGKTMLLRSWARQYGPPGRVAWVSVERGERDPQRFWLSVVGALESAVCSGGAAGCLTPAPGFDGEKLVGRLVADLASIDEAVVLVIDDVHELAAADALGQLELLVRRRPEGLRLILATRRDPGLGLHRLRLAGELTEVREAELRFTARQTRELLDTAGVALSEEGLQSLHRRTEGWAAGIRLAAISLAGHPDPDRFVAEFSGNQRAVADYLVAEVLDRQPEDVRRLLLSTSVLEQVSGPLADFLTGAGSSERLLRGLEEANALVVALDAGRSWFRYHHLFADLLRYRLRSSDPAEVPRLHALAAQWYAGHGYVVDAVRHAQAAGDWPGAARLLADCSLSLALDGQEATAQALLAGFPAEVLAENAELAVVAAGVQLARGTLDDAAAYLGLAQRHAERVPGERHHRFQVALTVARLSLARCRGDFAAAAAEAQRLLALVSAETASDIVLGHDLRAVALMNLGVMEAWTRRSAEAERHLREAIDLARRIERPYIEVGCLGYLGFALSRRSLALGAAAWEEAIAQADTHGWEADPVAAPALIGLAAMMTLRGRYDEAGFWADRGDRALRRDLEPAIAQLLHLAKADVCTARGQLDQALAEYRAAEAVQAMLVTPHRLSVEARSRTIQAQARLGQTEAARASIKAVSEDDRTWGESRVAIATAYLAESSPQAAADALAPVLDGSAPVGHDGWLVHALLLDAIARDQLGDQKAAEAAVERALAVAEPQGLILPFSLTAVHDLLRRHPRHRTAHAALLAEILDVLSGSPRPQHADHPPVLSDGEARVLRFLPSNLSAAEIAAQTFVSVNAVKTHMRHIYAKLGVHTRTEAVEQARRLTLLSPPRR